MGGEQLVMYVPQVFIFAGIFTMCFAGVRYWISDPIQFLVIPPWELWQRALFRRPGYRIYVAGCGLCLAGPALLVFRWFTTHSLTP